MKLRNPHVGRPARVEARSEPCAYIPSWSSKPTSTLKAPREALEMKSEGRTLKEGRPGTEMAQHTHIHARVGRRRRAAGDVQSTPIGIIALLYTTRSKDPFAALDDGAEM